MTRGAVHCWAILVVLSLAASAQRPQTRAAEPAGWGRISGVVLDHGNKPVEGAEVYAQILGVAINLILPLARTDSNGNFEFARLAWGRYLIGAGKPSAGYPRGDWGELYDTSHAPVVVLAKGHIADRITVRIGPKAALLLLSIVDASGGKPLSESGPASPGMSWVTYTPTKRTLSGSLGPGSTLFIPSGRDFVVSIWARGYKDWRKTLHLPPGARRRLLVPLQPDLGKKH